MANKNNLMDADQTTPSLKQILHIVAEEYGLSVEDIRGRSRKKAESEARSVFCFFAYEQTSYTLAEIGGFLDGRTHSTITIAISKIAFQQKHMPAFGAKIARLREKIEAVEPPLPAVQPKLIATPNPQQLSTREQEMLAMQRGSFNQPLAALSQLTLPKKPLKEELSEELLFKFGYVPFVIAEVAWDYIDTIFDITQMLKIGETRKLTRRLKELRKDYLYLRRSIYHGKEQHEYENMLHFEDILAEDFSKIYSDGVKAITGKYPDLDRNYISLLSCVYECRIVFEALFKYVRDMSEKVVEYVGHPIGNILPSHLREMYNLVIEYVGDCPIGEDFEEIQRGHVANLVKYIHSIQLNKQ